MQIESLQSQSTKIATRLYPARSRPRHWMMAALATVLLCLTTTPSHAAYTFSLKTTFGNGQITMNEAEGYLETGGTFTPSFTSGAPGVISDFVFDVTAAAPIGPRTFTTSDIFFAEWLVSGASLLLRLSAFQDLSPGFAGVNLTNATGFEIASNTACNSVGFGELTDNIACIFNVPGSFADFAISDSFTTKKVSVAEPSVLSLLAAFLAFASLWGWKRQAAQIKGRP